MVSDNRWLLYQKKAEIAKELQNWDEVESAYKGMTREIQGKAEGFYQLGLLYLRQGEKELAYEMLKEAENNFHENAEDMILTHCQEFLQSDNKSMEKDLMENYADEFVNNEKSVTLKNAFGKLWKLDEKKTIDNNEVLNNLPSEMRVKILETFKSMLVRISPKGVYIFNLGQDDSRALYSIEEESGDKVTIQMLRFDSSESQAMDIQCGDNYLIICNLGGSRTNLNLHFISSNLREQSEPVQKNYKEKESAGSMDFLK
jgi:tetratricopeptide (TPR) repeat protein